MTTQPPLLLSSRARASSIILISVPKRTLTSSPASSRSTSSSKFRRSDFSSQPYTGSYDPNEPTGGPLGDASILGALRSTPRILKQHLDQFVVGQERAKKILSVSVFNHYQRIQELRRREEEEENLLQQKLRRERGDGYLHSVEDEFPGHQDSIPLYAPGHSSSIGAPPIHDASPLNIEKTNILLLGPSGVGKTLMAKTLARVLSVPFSMSDCTPFTQAGYIGEDAQVCVERLLAAANWDVEAAEHGIICLDEVDKLAATKTAHGKDVGGEGVQQSLLKIIEGTTLHIQSKGEPRSTRSATIEPANPTGSPMYGGKYTPSPPLSSSGSGSGSTSPSSGPTLSSSSKSETYSIRTDNILFIFTGAFIGLQKHVLNRINKGSMGFTSRIKSISSFPVSENSRQDQDTTLSVKTGSEEDKLFEKHLPFFTPHLPGQHIVKYNPLDLLEPTDLQAYGMIPELVGRIPVSAALASLDLDDLVRVLTEPRNSIIKQYETLFALSSIEMRFTRGALRAVAKSALGMGTGARGLRTVVERLLAESMFEAPGSSIKHILITEDVAKRKCPPVYLARGQQVRFQNLLQAEEDFFDRRERGEAESVPPDGAGTFEQYRERFKASGAM